jgi:4a-hydroxytetrahydrobiopterin dehydratase
MLAQKKCIPCGDNTPALTGDEVKKLLAEIDGWHLSVDGKHISRRYTFPDFMTALGFVTKIAGVAEMENHHPDIMLGWGYVECKLWTHSIGGLHENDFIMASKINLLHG